MTKDTLLRPANVSLDAKLLNLGSDDEPLFAWTQTLGSLKINNLIYPYILCVKYTFKSGMEQTSCYENLELRLGKKKINWGGFKILRFPFSGNIKISDGKDTLYLFEVLVEKTWVEKKKSVYTDVATVKTVADGSLLSTKDLACNLVDNGNGNFLLILDNGMKLKYKVNQSGGVNNKTISFINRDNGNVYFIDKSCFLKLLDTNDLLKLKTD
jgi:hypothetical protein